MRRTSPAPLPDPHVSPSPTADDPAAVEHQRAPGPSLRAARGRARATLPRLSPVGIAGLVLTASSLAFLHASARDRGAPEPSHACIIAVLIDGVLHCDDDVPRDFTALCGEDHLSEPLPLVAGDAIDRARLCIVPRPRRGEPGWDRMSADDLTALAQPIDVNTAALSELESLHGVGPKLAVRIAEGRPYATCEELLRVRGIGPRTLARMCPRVRVPGPSP